MLQSKIKLTAPFGVAKQKEQLPVATDELTQLENEVHEGLTEGTKGFLKAAQAIRKIRDSRLYLAKYSTFEDYCTQKLGRSRSAIYQQLKRLAIAEGLNTQETLNVQAPSHDDVDSEALTQEKQATAEIVCTKPAIFPGSQLPQPEPKKPFRTKRMKPDNEPVFTPQVILNGVTQWPKEITQWRLEIDRRITEQQDNPGFRQALTEWLDESGL